MRATEFIEADTSKIPVVWNTNPDDMQSTTLHYLRTGTLARANIRELFNKTPKKYRLDPDDPTGGKNKIRDRVARAIQYWKDGGRMDPSIVAIHNRSVNFIDGRHRLVAASQLGETEAPVVVVRADQFQKAQELLNITKWN